LSCWLGAALLHSHCLCSGKHGLSNWPSLFLLRDALVSRRWNKLASCWCMLTLLHTTNFPNP
jgi:hypothetical protein